MLDSCGTTNDVASNRRIQKRKYNKGFYFERGTSGHERSEESEVAETETKFEWNQETEITSPEKTENLVSQDASYDFDQIEGQQISEDFEEVEPADNKDCDEIIMKSGESQWGLVIQVTKKTVDYKGCDEEFGPTYSVPSQDVWMIRYANGEKELVEETLKELKDEEKEEQEEKVDEKEEESTDNSEAKIDIFGIISLGCAATAVTIGLLLFPIGIPSAIAAMVFGIISIIRIKKNPDKYKGAWMAWVGLGVGGGYLIGLAVYIWWFIFF